MNNLYKNLSMKKTTCNALITLIALFLQLTVSAQNVEFTEGTRTPGYWTLGINGGLSYQQSDVCSTLDGFGVGLTLAKNLYYKPGDFFTFDLRGRALYAQSYGLDAERSYGINRNDALNGVDNSFLDYSKANGSTGFVFQNHKTHQGELGLEGVLTFNQLRERTNVILSVFGGVGIDWYKTNLDQRNGDQLYTAGYSAIDTLRSVSSIRQNLKNNILDGDYETSAQGYGDFGRIGIMPNLGLELGYQLTPSFSVGVGHKVTFARTDLLDGQKWENNNLATNDNDIHHYTNLNLRWIIQAKQNKLDPPLIEIIEPFNNPHTSRSPNGYVRAKISNINSAMDIDYLVNGRPHRFDFNRGYLTSSILLEPGRNEVLITATNAAGRDQKKVIFLYQEVVVNDPVVIDDPVINDPTPSYQRPEVDITNPYRNNETFDNRRYTVTADVLYVSNKRDITFTLNGRTQNFRYDANRQQVTADVNLSEGENRIKIEARNRDGSAKDEAVLYFEPQNYDLPTVRITKPYSDPHQTKNTKEVIEAKIEHVGGKEDITYRVNGKSYNKFDFAGEVFYADAFLRVGKNTVEVLATNENGNARDQVIIYLEEEIDPVQNPPVVTITQPNRSSTSTGNDRATIKATVLNVDRKGDITFTVNGKRTNNFSFNSRTALLSATVDLDLGNNRIIIEGRNDDGRDEASVNIQYKKEVVLQRPPVVTISQPRNNSSTEDATTNLTAKVLNVDSKNNIELTVNGKRVFSFAFNNSKKSVTARINLKEGNNVIRLMGSNDAGQDEASVRVLRKVVQLNPPTVKIIRPTDKSTANEDVTLQATVTNMTSKQGIQVFVNGKAVRGFSYVAQASKVTATLRLEEGNNKIVVKATNADGTAQDDHTIRYTKSVAPPKVTITNPKNNAVFSKATTEIQARIIGVDNKRNISFYLNGKAQKSFNFNRDRLTANVKLKNGVNTILIRVVNEGGRDEDKVQVKFIKPIPQVKPVVEFINPSKSGTSVRKGNTNIKVKVLHVAAKKDITLKVGGRSVKQFKYNTRTKELTASISLKSGNNVVFVEASNNAGKANAETTIKYASTVIIAPTKAPKIKTFSMSQPTANPLNPNQGKSRVTATFENVTATKDITLVVNGTTITGFNYDPKTKKISVIVSIIKGQNNVNLKVKTKGGTDEQTKNLDF